MKLLSYVKTVWKAGREGGTAWTPERLNNIEDGIEQATNQINTNSEDIESINTDIDTINTNIEEINTDISEINSNLSHVGMIIHSTTLDTMEKVIAIYGGTKWVKIEGRFLLGQSSSYNINSIGGESTHTLTVNEMPSHSHSTSTCYSDNSPWDGIMRATNRGGQVATGVNATGGGQAHNNMPPYKVVYIWERTV